jgi:hypothetical protein
MKRQSEGIHLNELSTHHTSRSPSVDQTLDKLAVVGSHALHGGSLDFLKDEVTSINHPQPCSQDCNETASQEQCSSSMSLKWQEQGGLAHQDIRC